MDAASDRSNGLRKEVPPIQAQDVKRVKDLKPRAMQILVRLLQQGDPVKTGELAERHQLTPRSIRYDLDEIEQAVLAYGIHLVRRRSGIWLEGTPDKKQKILNELQVARSIPVDQSAADMRLCKLLAVLLFAKEPVLVKQLEDVLEASPRTIYSDMDRAEGWLERTGLQLLRKRHYGARVEGPELLRRYGALRLAREWGHPERPGSDRPERPLQISAMDAFLLSRLAHSETLSLLQSGLCEIRNQCPLRETDEWILFLAIQVGRIQSGCTVSLSRTHMKQVMDTTEYTDAKEVAAVLATMFSVSFSDEEIACIALYLLGAFSQTQLDEETFHRALSNPLVEDIVTQMLLAVDSTLGTFLMEDADLFRGLVLHVKPMVYRLFYDIPVQNYLIEDIRAQHTLAYQAAVIACRNLENLSRRPVSAAEIGFIALHIGAALERRRIHSHSTERRVRVLVVCAGGIGTGKILQSQIEASNENLQVVGTVDVNRVQEAETLGADVIISSLPLDNAPRPHIVVHPLLPAHDKKRISEWLRRLPGVNAAVAETARLRGPIRQLIEQSFQVIQSDAVDVEIDNMLQRIVPYLGGTLCGGQGCGQSIDLTVGKKVYRMIDLLTAGSIRVRCLAHSRDEVVDLAGELLVETGGAERRYVDAMKQSIAKNGPYMVIVPGVALLHARPEDGVQEVCMSLVTLEEAIPFGHPDNDPVDIAIAFGAVDQHQHLEAMTDLMRLLADEQSMRTLRAAKNVDEVHAVLARVTRQ
ncbi:transcription antiterminator BglG [Alicyclobacillus acidoterrestris]|nr:transcription antiterminator BglG [Alicyclobacillus acidoterrestris]